MVTIQMVTDQKQDYMELLLLADEQEDMIQRYLSRGDMFVLKEDGDVRAECVVTKEADVVYEPKNIAVYGAYQRMGYGKMLVDYLIEWYRGSCSVMYVGTGDSPVTLTFYERCGFVYSHRLKNFFTDNYDHPMFEDGKQLVDMIYLKREL